MKKGGKTYQLMDPAGEEDELPQDEMWDENGGTLILARRNVRRGWLFVKEGLHRKSWRYIFLFLLFICYLAGYATYLGIFTKSQNDYHLKVLVSSEAPDNGNETAPWIRMSLATIDVTMGTLRLNVRGQFYNSWSPSGLILQKSATLIINEQSFKFNTGSISSGVLGYVNIRLGDGSVYLYPFDSYETRITFYLLDQNGNVLNISTELGAREYGGYDFEIDEFQRHELVPEAYTFVAKSNRDPLFVVYPIFQIVAFWFITIWAAGMSISITMFGLKKAEGFLLIVTASLLFALPSFRNTAPQAPPIGCVLDVSSFYWAMFGVLGLFFGVSVRYLQHAPLPPVKAAPAPPAPAKG